MDRALRPRRTAAALAALSLGALLLTACGGGDAGKDTGTPATSAAPSPAGTGEPSATPSTAGPGDGGGSSTPGGSPDDGDGTPPPSKAGSDDDQDGGVGMCETHDMAYTVTVASKPAHHALLTAVNKGGAPCLLPVNELVITIPGLDGAAEHVGPEDTDRIVEPGGRAYAGIRFSRGDDAGGKSADKVEVALTAAETPATLPVGDGPVTVNDMLVTSFLTTAEDALSY
ncbi:DUF4232 domain-containing protein [Streptomyces abyssomicinicus]|uniref:DUF4232 domain-containing protein n=1 Tax=Streptomyces abyssomicinicus TaxID=574929 RepID=UPI0012509A4B|nr:DUF4232 domain-containing protein [Streptomyces abyssomicinicus]